MCILSWILLSIPLIISALAGVVYLTGNIRVQDKGRFIRSAQLSEKRFKKLLKKHKVKTVVNLRGTDDAPHEKVICEEMGIDYFAPEWESRDIPTKESLRRLVRIFEMSNEPIYVHCLGGADRSGEVSAIYHLMKGKTKKEALRQLTPWYFHIPYIRPAKRFFIERVWKGTEWAKNEYKGEL